MDATSSPLLLLVWPEPDDMQPSTVLSESQLTAVEDFVNAATRLLHKDLPSRRLLPFRLVIPRFDDLAKISASVQDFKLGKRSFLKDVPLPLTISRKSRHHRFFVGGDSKLVKFEGDIAGNANYVISFMNLRTTRITEMSVVMSKKLAFVFQVTPNSIKALSEPAKTPTDNKDWSCWMIKVGDRQLNLIREIDEAISYEKATVQLCNWYAAQKADQTAAPVSKTSKAADEFVDNIELNKTANTTDEVEVVETTVEVTCSDGEDHGMMQLELSFHDFRETPADDVFRFASYEDTHNFIWFKRGSTFDCRLLPGGVFLGKKSRGIGDNVVLFFVDWSYADVHRVLSKIETTHPEACVVLSMSMFEDGIDDSEICDEIDTDVKSGSFLFGLTCTRSSQFRPIIRRTLHKKFFGSLDAVLRPLMDARRALHGDNSDFVVLPHDESAEGDVRQDSDAFINVIRQRLTGDGNLTIVRSLVPID